MRTYVWSCLSCGAENLPNALRCQRCDCPACATVGDVQHFRARLESSGGFVSPMATQLQEEAQFPIIALLLAPFAIVVLLLFGVWPGPSWLSSFLPKRR